MHKHPVKIIISPRVTEKGAYLSQLGCYVFNVAPSTNKTEIAQAIKKIFKVTPRKIAIVTVPTKNVQTRGTNRKGVSGGGKKAYVYLKKGETIEIV